MLHESRNPEHEKLRQEVQEQVDAFLASGGKIQQLPPGASGMKEMSLRERYEASMRARLATQAE